LTATVAERGCGYRVQGGVYITCGIGPDGRPVEDFLFCPPLLLPPAQIRAMGLHSPRGIRVVQDQQTKVWHTFDVVGVTSYPNASDMVEEIRRFGLSRRAELQAQDYAKLTPESRHILLHPRAHIENHAELYAARQRERWVYEPCPKGFEHHNSLKVAPQFMCIALWYESLIGGESLRTSFRSVTRKMPAFQYVGAAPPDGFVPDYKLAIIGSFPITAIEVVKASNGDHEWKMERVRGAKVPTRLVDA
jgi:hypothetical protein